ncbi:MAG: hypothetical protein ACKOET_11380 [Verrucomicrobiota bacterium]
MGLIPGQGTAPEVQSVLQPFQRGLLFGSARLRPKNPVEAGLHQFLERGSTLGSHDLGAVQKILGEINRRLHGQ